MKIGNPVQGIQDKLKNNQGRQEQLKTACADFEALMLNEMFKSMRSTLSKTDILGGGIERDIYDSLYYQELATKIARSDNALGLGSVLYEKLKDDI